MNIEERMMKIDNAVERKKKEAKEKEDREFAEIESLINQCNEYSKRVKELLQVARYCVDVGIQIPIKAGIGSSYNAAEKYGYPYEFYAEGIRHHVGFIAKNPYEKRPKIIAIGIENGGACGQWDFYNTGEDMYSQHEDNGSLMSPRKEDMQQFLREFEPFEKAFYNFVDSL